LPFWTKVLRKKHKIEYINTVTVKYRIHTPSTEKTRGIVMSDNYAKNLLIYSKKYKKGNVKFAHYFFYNLALYLTRIYHNAGIAGKVKLCDQAFIKMTSVLFKVSVHS
jgi:hypothetical protein